MILGRILGSGCLALACLLLGVEIVESLEAGAYQGVPLGLVWSELDFASLNLAQAAIQRHVLPALWDPVIVTFLLWPGWIVFGVLGIALRLAFRRREKRKRWFVGRSRFSK